MAIANAKCKEADVVAGERAKGDFEIHAEDDALRRKFESIKKTIQEGHSGI